MALPSFCADAVTVRRAPLAESRGTEARDWPRAQSHEVAGCSVQFGSTSQDRGDARGLAASGSATLYAPPGSDIQAGDRVSCWLGEFEVDGEPMPRKSPTGAVSHTAAQLSRWRG